jgi:hypothetical protein
MMRLPNKIIKLNCKSSKRPPKSVYVACRNVTLPSKKRERENFAAPCPHQPKGVNVRHAILRYEGSAVYSALGNKETCLAGDGCAPFKKLFVMVGV